MGAGLGEIGFYITIFVRNVRTIIPYGRIDSRLHSVRVFGGPLTWAKTIC